MPQARHRARPHSCVMRRAPRHRGAAGGDEPRPSRRWPSPRTARGAGAPALTGRPRRRGRPARERWRAEEAIVEERDVAQVAAISRLASGAGGASRASRATVEPARAHVHVAVVHRAAATPLTIDQRTRTSRGAPRSTSGVTLARVFTAILDGMHAEEVQGVQVIGPMVQGVEAPQPGHVVERAVGPVVAEVGDEDGQGQLQPTQFAPTGQSVPPTRAESQPRPGRGPSSATMSSAAPTTADEASQARSGRKRRRARHSRR